MQWLNKLDEVETQPPLVDTSLAEIDPFLRKPLSEDEIQQLSKLLNLADNVDYSNWAPFPLWLPGEYKVLLSHSNGLDLVNGEREASLFGLEDLREYYIHYLFPEYMPDALPIGLNGGGIFYAYDLRNTSPTNPPIIATASGVLNWDDIAILGESLEDVFTKTTDIGDELYPAQKNSGIPLQGDLWLIKKANGGLKTLFKLKQVLEAPWSAAEMRAWNEGLLPSCILENTQPLAKYKKLAEHSGLLDLVGFSDRNNIPS
ncbi:MAG: SMI1/KNR4 family protein [Verrucomicrobiota bacterium]